MQEITSLRDGKAESFSTRSPNTVVSLIFTPGRGFAWEVSPFSSPSVLFLFFGVKSLNWPGIHQEDYAVMKACLATIRILQMYPNICLPPGVPNGPVGSERQDLTISLSSADGTKVLLKQTVFSA